MKNNCTKNTLNSTIVILMMSFVLSIIMLVAPVRVNALSGSDFNAGRIIDDAVFYNDSTMSVSQIQSFLNAKVPTCDTNGTQPYAGTTRAAYGTSRGYPPPYTCLKNYTQSIPGVINSPSDLCKNSITAGNKSAAQIIYDVSKACGINPQVMLVLLQKEQSLVTDDWPWSSQYRSATGYGCPDTAPCDSQYYGFFNQVYQAAKAFRRYEANPTSFNYRSGRNNYIYYHPSLGACGGTNVFISNQATANLYIYTPYQPNQSALNNLYGTGNSCSAYGNRNFWRMFNDWFGPTTRSLLFRINGTGTYYLEWVNNYYPIPNADVLEAYGLSGIAPRSITSFPEGKTRGSSLQRSAKFGSDNISDPDYTAQVDVVDSAKYHNVPNWSTLSRYGFTGWGNYDPSLKFLLKKGDDLTPIARKPNGGIYLIENSKKRAFPSWEAFSTLSGQNAQGVNQIYSAQKLTNLSATYINSVSHGAPMLLNGQTFSSIQSPAIYMFEDGTKRLFSSSTYSAWGGKTNFNFDPQAISEIPSGDPVDLLVKSAAGQNFAVSNGSKYLFNTTDMTEWGLLSTDFIAYSDKTLSTLTTKNMTRLVSGSGAGVYYIDDGQRHGIPSLSDFSKLGFSWSNVIKLNNSLIDAIPRGPDIYSPGALVRKPNGAVYLIDENYTAMGVSSGALFSSYGFNWSKVKNVSNNGLTGFTYENLGSVLYVPTANKYYAISKGKYHEIPSSLSGASVFNTVSVPKNEVNNKVIESLDKGPQITRFLKGDGATVYYIENGQKRPFKTVSSFYSKGGTWETITYVDEVYLSTIPRGTSL